MQLQSLIPLYFTGITTYIYTELTLKLMAMASVAQSVERWSRDQLEALEFAFFATPGPGWVLKCISF